MPYIGGPCDMSDALDLVRRLEKTFAAVTADLHAAGALR